MHGVWRSPQTFLPAYADLDLVSYLASLGFRHPGIAVVPVFSSEPVYFRGNHIVFLSTGFILQAAGEKELTEAIRNARVELQSTRVLPACAAMAPAAPADFSNIQRRLAEQTAAYQDVTARRLRRRDLDHARQ